MKHKQKFTRNGNVILRDPARIDFAIEELRQKTYNKVRESIMERFGVGLSCASMDISEAKRVIGLELDAVSTRAAETRRNERIADRAEEAAKLAEEVGDHASAVGYLKTAVAASAQVAKLTGAAAPTKLDVKHSGSVNVNLDVELKLDAVLEVTSKILTPEEYSFLMGVLEKLAAAQDAGAFKELEPPVDAEIVDDDAEEVDDASKN